MLAYCDGRSREIITACATEALPLPVVGYELTDRQGRVCAEAELAWESRKVAVLLPERMEAAEAFRDQGWKVFCIPDLADPQPLLALLRG